MWKGSSTRRSPGSSKSRSERRKRSCTGPACCCAGTSTDERNVVMTDRFAESLSDYLDGELTAEDRREVALHLETCAECAQAARELEQVIERARTLSDLTPPRDLWPTIEAQLMGRKEAGTEQAAVSAPAPLRPARRPRTRVVSFTWPQLVAAGLAVALLATAAFWLGTR